MSNPTDAPELLPPSSEQAKRIVATWRSTDQYDSLLVFYIAQAIDDNIALRASSAPAGQGEAALLATAIANAAKKAGIYNGKVPLSGPQLLLLCDDLAARATLPSPVPDAELTPRERVMTELNIKYANRITEAERIISAALAGEPEMVSSPSLWLAAADCINRYRSAPDKGEVARRIAKALEKRELLDVVDETEFRRAASIIEAELGGQP